MRGLEKVTVLIVLVLMIAVSILTGWLAGAVISILQPPALIYWITVALGALWGAVITLGMATFLVSGGR